MSESMQLAIVGHTNVGKTSLLRTLTRNTRFGEVSPQHSTTRHVERISLTAGSQPLLDLYDTPGLEDAMALLAYVEQLAAGERTLDGPARIERFLASSAAGQRFEQEAKVLRQLLKSDAALYVIDAREPVLAKYRDELTLLHMCGKPLLPVLNFTHGPNQQTALWRDALARLGLHAVICFDSVSPPEDGEQGLYDSLALLRQDFRPALLQLQDWNRRQSCQRQQAALLQIAELLVDVAATRLAVRPEQAATELEHLQHWVRQREQACVARLLDIYAFDGSEVSADEVPLQSGRWSTDLFSSEALKDAGIKLGSGAAAGAAVGLGVDVMTGGLSLGMGTLVGGLLGGTAQWSRSYGKRMLNLVQGYEELTVNDAILLVLQARQLHLLDALRKRGHAARDSIRIDLLAAGQDRLPEPLKQARSQPEWSSLGSRDGLHDRDRAHCVEQLAAQLSPGH
ncbi:MAG: GTPase/DUF3482 domain-containing protein [Thiopseudomonas sp.]|nr:GTPase/DUF3482 domain-containing protein [Gammaproteobacteria bacterium]